MSDNVYTYSISTTFPSGVVPDVLQTLIAGTYPDITSVDTYGDAINFHFSSPLGDQSAFTTFLGTYVYVPIKVPKDPNVEALVATDGTGDYTSVAAAFADGNASVRVLNGTYIETADVVIPTGGIITGESLGRVILVMTGGSRVVSDGNGGTKVSNGTLSATTTSATVTGTSTTFTSLQPGYFVFLAESFYQIASIESDTSLTLTSPYVGAPVTNETYFAQTMNTALVLTNLIITGSSGAGLYLRAAHNSVLKNVALVANYDGLQLLDSGNIAISIVVFEYQANNGVVIDNCHTVSFDIVNVFNSAQVGVTIQNGSTHVQLTHCASKDNWSDGVHIDGSSNVCIKNAFINYNNGNGVNVTNTSSMVNVSDSFVRKNAGDGIKMYANKSVVDTDHLEDNGGNGLFIAATDVIVSACLATQNNVGIALDSTAVDAIVTSCNLKGNTTNYTDAGTGTIDSNNKT